MGWAGAAAPMADEGASGGGAANPNGGWPGPARDGAANELRAANRQQDAFLATLSHELRNPMGAIVNCLALLRLAGDTAAAREHALERAHRQVAHMERLIEDLLDTNRLTRGELTLRRLSMELQPTLDLAVETAAPLFDHKGQTPSLYLPAHPVPLYADPVRVAQMVTNLLNNASKCTGVGGRIVLAVAIAGETVEICVRDDGIGIAPQHLNSIFTMFSQIHSVREAANDGLGIGLNLVQNLAQLHGGSIEARSEGEGMGAEFVLRLPLQA